LWHFERKTGAGLPARSAVNGRMLNSITIVPALKIWRVIACRPSLRGGEADDRL